MYADLDVEMSGERSHTRLKSRMILAGEVSYVHALHVEPFIEHVSLLPVHQYLIVGAKKVNESEFHAENIPQAKKKKNRRTCQRPEEPMIDATSTDIINTLAALLQCTLHETLTTNCTLSLSLFTDATGK